MLAGDKSGWVKEAFVEDASMLRGVGAGAGATEIFGADAASAPSDATAVVAAKSEITGIGDGW